MEILELGLLLLAAVLVSSVIDQIVPKISSPLIQIALGVVIALVAGRQIHIELDPELFLVLFIAPLLYDEARHADQGELWKNIRPVLSVAIGLVIAIALITGFVLHWLVPSVPLAAAFALGAALGPTDAVAVASLPKDASIGTRQRSILKGECLINDASGIVSFQFAIAAAVTGSFSLAEASADFVVSFFGGLALGAVLGFAQRWIVGKIQSLGLENTTFHVLLDILTPFIVFIISEMFHVSGIIAVVCAGLIVSRHRPVSPYVSRLKIVSSSVWRVISYALNGLVFVLLGTQLPRAMESSWKDVDISNANLLAYVVAITAVIVVVRFAWLVAVEYVHHRGIERDGLADHRFGKRELLSALIMTIGGPKGTITLSIMFTIPVFASTGELFPQRDLLIFLACGVIVCTLLLANFGIPLLAPKRTAAIDEEAREREVKASIDILRSVVEELTSRRTPETRRATQSVIHQYNSRIAHIKERNDVDDEDENAELRIKALEWEEKECERLLESHEVQPEVAYDYLDELARMKNLLRHRGSGGSLRIALLKLRSRFESARHNLVDGVPFLSESDRTTALREAKLKARVAVMERLQNNIAEISAPSEDVSALVLEYSRSVAALRAGRPSITAMAGRANKSYDVQQMACDLELEAIQQAYEDELISRATARRMRENVDIMRSDLNELV